jgi:glycogen debranching enzyme
VLTRAHRLFAPSERARECASAARKLAEGLLAVAERFGYRLPELFSGDGADPVPFPAACRPQAWSAAAGIVVMSALEQISLLAL